MTCAGAERSFRDRGHRLCREESAWSVSLPGTGNRRMPGARQRHDQGEERATIQPCWHQQSADSEPSAVLREQLIALPARQRCAQPSRAPFGRQDPGAHLPRRLVSNVLRMSACELGDPVLFQVLAKTDDALLAH